MRQGTGRRECSETLFKMGSGGQGSCQWTRVGVESLTGSSPPTIKSYDLRRLSFRGLP